MEDLRDERALMGLTAGVVWLVAAATAATGAFLPGSPHIRVTPFVVTEALFVLYGAASLLGWIPWRRLSIRGQALWTAAMLPPLAVALWATGGADSYVQPLVLFPLLQITYFFALRESIPLVGLAVAAFTSPVIYNSAGGHHVYPARALGVGVGASLMVYFVRLLKSRLFEAERLQRQMALTDPLTGLANRRAFDEALAGAVVRGDVERGRRAGDDGASDAVLLLIDLDDFKGVNDSRGHGAGDDLLRAVAAHCHAVVRPGDTVARIGGDEFAVIAPGAGRAGAERLAEDLSAAIEAAGSHATIAWASHPVDGHDPEALLRAADHRLYEGKALGREFAPVLSVSA